MADEDPNKLERYVGDYVFNPKTTQREIPLNQPVEVLEIGTGFMMVRRKTFEDYQKVYPHLWYKPDHVRTEHFDGSREIMAYFDCVIDRGYQMEQLDILLKDVANGKEQSDLTKRANELLEQTRHASKRYLSEDYMFCYNVQRMGGKVWFCPWMQLQHVGSYIFGGSLADLASIGASATADQSKLKHKKQK